MLDFKVHYDNADYCGTSKVYAIDNNRDRFLVATPYGKFLWVNTEDCTLADEDSRISFITKLETVLEQSGCDGWEIGYLPKKGAYVLSFDKDVSFELNTGE